MARDCMTKHALFHGLRPSQTKQICGVCPSRCIYCDIWKLAILISTHIPISMRRSLPSSSRPSSPTHQETFEWQTSERMIEARFATQKARLSSIMSIATVDGAEQSEGLRVAHERCLGEVKQLLYQEKVLEQTIVRAEEGHRLRRVERWSEEGLRMERKREEQRSCGRSYYERERAMSKAVAL